MADLFREFVYGLRVDGVIVIGDGSLIRNPDQVPLISTRAHSAANADTIR